MALEEFDCRSALQTGRENHFLGYQVMGWGRGPQAHPWHLYLLKNTCRERGTGWWGWPERGRGAGRSWQRLCWQCTE